MEPVEIERPEDGIAILRLNDPRYDNHLTETLCRSWIAALHRLAADSSLHVLLIRGLTKVFCAGASAEELKQIAAGKVQIRDLELPDSLLKFPVPVIAAMEGHAAGGGFVAALCCDLLVAANDRRYGLNFTELGFTPGMGITRLLPALLGYHHAAEVLFSGRFFRGDELAARGLFNSAVPSPEVFPRALDLARQIAPKPRHVLEMTKAALCLPRRLSLAEALSQEHLMHRICFSTPCEPPVEAEKYFPTGVPRQ